MLSGSLTEPRPQGAVIVFSQKSHNPSPRRTALETPPAAWLPTAKTPPRATAFALRFPQTRLLPNKRPAAPAAAAADASGPNRNAWQKSPGTPDLAFPARSA